LFTKADKQGSVKSQQNMAAFKRELANFFEEVPQMILTSAENQLGKDDVLALIHEINGNFVIPEFEERQSASLS
jgi:GTP-binding protein